MKGNFKMNKRRSKHLIWIFIAMFTLTFFIPENLDAGTKKNIRIGKYWKPYADSGDEGEGNIGSVSYTHLTLPTIYSV